MGSAVIWSGALHASATILAGGADGARWGINQPGSAAWGASAGPMAATRAGLSSWRSASSWSCPMIPKPVSHKPRKRRDNGLRSWHGPP
jgi:hypothetical protein